MTTLSSKDRELLGRLRMPITLRQRTFIETHWRESKATTHSKWVSLLDLGHPTLIGFLVSTHFIENMVTLVSIAEVVIWIIMIIQMLLTFMVAFGASIAVNSDDPVTRAKLLERPNIYALVSQPRVERIYFRMQWIILIAAIASVGLVILPLFTLFVWGVSKLTQFSTKGSVMKHLERLEDEYLYQKEYGNVVVTTD